MKFLKFLHLIKSITLKPVKNKALCLVCLNQHSVTYLIMSTILYFHGNHYFCRDGSKLVHHIYVFESERQKQDWLNALRYAKLRISKY